MRRDRGGYSIIEVMIVLAISGVLFTSAILVFQGQQGKTVLSQTLFDLASKIQGYASDVTSGVYDDSATYGCTAIPGSPPVLDAGGSSNSSCLFLGRALQIVQNQPSMYVYTVLGNRVDASNNLVSKFDNANPEPALDNTGNWVLNDRYDLPSGMKFSSSKVKGLSGALADAYMVGIYIDLAGETGSGGSSSLSARGYSLSSGASPNSAAVKACIEQQSPCNSPKNVQIWQICIQDGTNTGSINIESSASGVTTRVNSLECA